MRTSAGGGLALQSKPCPNGTLVGFQPGALLLVPNGCHRWSCDHCGWKNAKKLASRIVLTKADRFITLTIRMSPGHSALEQLDMMNRAWRLLWKRLRRRFGTRAVGYVKVVELTQKGTPHFHVAVTCPFISQRWLSAQWRELTASSVVDIRRIKSERGLARYLSKYLTKGSETVSHRRKFSASRSFLPPAPAREIEPGEIPPSWNFSRTDHTALEASLEAQGWHQYGQWWLSASGPVAPT